MKNKARRASGLRVGLPCDTDRSPAMRVSPRASCAPAGAETTTPRTRIFLSGMLFPYETLTSRARREIQKLAWGTAQSQMRQRGGARNKCFWSKRTPPLVPSCLWRSVVEMGDELVPTRVGRGSGEIQTCGQLGGAWTRGARQPFEVDGSGTGGRVGALRFALSVVLESASASPSRQRSGEIGAVCATRNPPCPARQRAQKADTTVSQPPPPAQHRHRPLPPASSCVHAHKSSRNPLPHLFRPPTRRPP